VKSKIFHERLDLINQAKHKLTTMQNKNVYTLDIEAMRLLDALSSELQEILTENILLQNKNKVLSARIERFRRKKSAKSLRSKPGREDNQ